MPGPFSWPAPRSAVIAPLTLSAYWRVGWYSPFSGADLVREDVDVDPPGTTDVMMRDRALFATDNYERNAAVIQRLVGIRTSAVFVFGDRDPRSPPRNPSGVKFGMAKKPSTPQPTPRPTPSIAPHPHVIYEEKGAPPWPFGTR